MNIHPLRITARQLLLSALLIAAAQSSVATQCADAPLAVTERTAAVGINHCPRADAGMDLPVSAGQQITLDASGSSDADGDLLSYLWRIAQAPLGSGAVIADEYSVRTSFTPDLDGHYVLELMIKDAAGAVSTDQLLLSTRGAPPVAEAGADQTIALGKVVSLDGIGSFDLNDAALDYTWRLVEQPVDSQASIDHKSGAAAAFTADVRGDYVAALVVDNGRSASATDYVRVSTINSRPTADAGRDRTLAPGSTLNLDGARSADRDGQSLKYQWSLLSQPADADVTLTEATQMDPSLYLTIEGLYVFQLIVDDGELLSEAATMIVDVDAQRLHNVNPDDYKHLSNRGGGDDEDGDGIIDADDNCVLAFNDTQLDTDGDGIGNACDPDLNNDGVVNVVDLGILRSVFFTNDPDADFNGDGIVNVIDLGILRSRFFLPPGPAGTIIWVSLVDGDFDNRLNWQPQIVPTAGSLALIDVGTDVVVTAQSDTIVVKGLVNNETLDLRSGSFTATDALENGGLIEVRGASLNDTQVIPSLAGSGDLNLITTSTWRNITLGVETNIFNNASMSISDGLTVNSTLNIISTVQTTGLIVNATMTIDGTGTIAIDGTANSQIGEPRIFPVNGTTLTIASGLTIRGGKGTIGNISANLVFDGIALADIDGEALRLSAGNMTGTGTARAQNGGLIEMDANLDNGGGTFNIDGADGGVRWLNTMAVRNGTIQMTPGTTANLVTGSVILDNAVINGNLFIPNNTTVNVFSGLTLNGVASILSTAQTTGFVFNNTMTLNGNATIMIDGTANSVIAEPRLLPVNSTTLTIGPNVNIQGGKGTIGNLAAGLIFQGTLTADLDGQELAIGGSNWSANNAMTAVNNGGIRFFGSMNNSGDSLDIDTADGTFNINNASQINNATINGTTGSTLILPSGSSTWTSSTMDIDIEMRNSTTINVLSGLTLNNDMRIISTAQTTGLVFINTQTLNGTGTITFDAAGNLVPTEPRLLPANGTTLTIGPGITVRGGNGTIGNLAAGLVFNGTLIADVADTELNIGGSLWSASQILSGSNGGGIELFGTLDNDGGAFLLDNPDGPVRVRGATILREVTINGTPGTNMRYLASTTIDAAVITADMTYNNGASSNVQNGFTLNGIMRINAPTVTTGLVFQNSQLFDGDATVIFDSAANSVITEPRLFPANGTVLTFGPNVRVEGGSGTVGNLAATVNLGDATIDANVDGKTIQITGATWSATGTLRASNGGDIRMAGALRNANASFVLDGAGGTITMATSASFNDAVINGTAGTAIDVADGTFDNLTYTGDLNLNNGDNVNVVDGFVLNGTATIDAPTITTGFVFLNTQTVSGNATLVLNGGANSVPSEPRLLPANGTALTIAPTVTVSGNNGTLGSLAAEVDMQGTMIADGGSLIFVRPQAGITGTLEAANGNTLTVNNVTTTTSGQLTARPSSRIVFTGDLIMNASTTTSIEVDATGTGVVSADSVDHDGTLNMSAVNGFAPTIGSSFTVTELAGTNAFATVNSAGLGGGQAFVVTYDGLGQAVATVN
ncbi:MAG: PKD domain-containing protein [Gammaproteobacteria bacterium]